MKYIERMYSNNFASKFLFFLIQLKYYFKLILIFKRTKQINISNNNLSSYNIFFIIGSGRSGNTLLRAMLLTKKNVVIPPELHCMGKMIVTALKNRNMNWFNLCSLVMNVFFNAPSSLDWHLDKNKLRDRIKKIEPKNRNIENLILSFYHAYAEKNGYNENYIIGDKTPLNSSRLFLINIVFKKAKYIHIHRDGRDVVNSYVKSKIYKSYKYAAFRWNRNINQIFKFKLYLDRKKSKNRFHSLSYENLVMNGETTVRKLCKFLDIKYDIKMINSYSEKFNSMGDTHQKHHSNIRKKIFSSSIGNWKKTPMEQQKIIYPIIQKNLKKLYN